MKLRLRLDTQTRVFVEERFSAIHRVPDAVGKHQIEVFPRLANFLTLRQLSSLVRAAGPTWATSYTAAR
jgi:hypothetical protein